MEKNDTGKAGFIPAHGGYRKLLSYKKSEIVYDGTLYFTERFFHKYDRTVSQMVQAARSGKQNIAEASIMSGTSKETEIKLTNVARASLEELQIDFEDFLRKNKLRRWEVNHPTTTQLRHLNKTTANASYETFKPFIEHEIPEYSANCMITLISITSWLLKQQISSLEAAYIRNQSFRENMLMARSEFKSNTK